MERCAFAIALLLSACGGNGFEAADPAAMVVPPVVDDGARPPADRPDAELGADAGPTTAGDAGDAAMATRDVLADAWPSDVLVVLDAPPSLPHCPNCYNQAGTNVCCVPNSFTGAACHQVNEAILQFCAECPGNPPFDSFTSCMP